ncbi:SpaA isopeptide-forming pilin-related protein [Gemmiger sp.]|uniref:SpaA isopeptide-forming pilin-related protein n=1 Tax=Gemmiger sp. TaxID=2049027 RepID=UPI0025C18B8B|nr:SpaA isopeptide-forming pilin-related protein [Gemmiger sp.]
MQAVSEQEATDGFTVYFVVPDKIEGQTVLDSYEIKLNVKTEKTPGNSKDGWWHPHPMEWTGWKTKDGHKIYAVKNCKDIEGTKFEVIQFQFRDGSTWKGQIELNNNLGPIKNYNNRMYDPTANNNTGEWTDNPILKDHTYYADKPIKFENRSTADLTNVKANFYIPDENETLKLVNDASVAQNVPLGEFVSFYIPNVACSYVQFTWDGDGHSKCYNFYNESVSGNDEESFLYSEANNCFIYTSADNVRWGKENSFRIYYDATFSWLSYENEKGETNGAIGCGMPTNDGKLWCYLTGDGKDPITKQEMNRLGSTNIWYYEVPDGYTKIRFASWAVENDNAAQYGDGTAMMDIPADLSEPCFFADASDDVIYNGGNRGGYWAEKGTLRNAKEGKKLTDDVVDIRKATFKEEANTKYVSSTLYDYYTDYELNGNNRDNYNSTYYTPGKGGGFASQKSWVVFRQFDRALSDYYSNCNAQYPIYTGHFQPTYLDWGIKFETISSELNLFGFNLRRFMAINNSTINEDGDGTRYDYAYQGLVADTTSNGKATGEPLLKDTKVVEPHFNKDFLSGTNTKNAKLGDVYNNVAFPFTKKQIFDEDTGVDYWYFDSQDTTLYLKQDSETKQYFLKSSTENRERSRNLDSTSAQKTITKEGKTEPVNSYGYFPFNETAIEGRASTYNYGFGTKLQMDFTLTDDGMVETKKIGDDGKPISTSIKFFFSGDDDVWVFIDGQLALDVGGAHGKVSGLLEFGETEENGKEKNSVTAYVSKVKKGGTPESNQNGSPAKTVKYNGEDINFYAQGTTLTFDKGQKHTLTMYYMERGMWESNMAVAFNFPDNNELQVQKKVDLTNVTDDEFKKCFTGQKIFNFTIQNQATHYGEKEAAKPDTGGVKSKKVDLTADVSSIAAATPDKEEEYIFRRETNPKPDPGNENEQVLHWYARYTDTEPVSEARYKRRGILTLNDPINIEKMRFLTFQVYVDSEDGGDLSLNNLYLELLDDQTPAVQKGSLGTTGINGATYGSVELKTGEWVTVKLDLNKMKKQDGFNDKVKTIRVGDNYSRNIYFRNFTFIPKAVPSTMSGFTTDQKDIPDYGSAKSGKLENAENAQYTSNMDTDTQLVDENGRFVLEDGEIVTFSDQFRRGSYISLKEDLNQSLYDTTWTVYENGQKVTSMSKGDSVSLPSTIPSLDGQKGSGPNDGRTEKKGAEEQNKYDGNKPSADTIVFRSYKDPDEKSSTLTKLKVQYVNTVKTGGLKIQKQAAAGEENTIKGTYKFKVTFNDVGGEGLEEKPIERIVTIDMSDTSNPDHTGTITGIPVGTRYTIEEVKTDDSRLQSVTVPKDCNSAHEIANTMVEGVINESNDSNDPTNLKVTAIFTNTKRTLINIEFNKLWKDANNKDIVTTNQPNEIYIQLQRRLANSAENAPWEVVDYPTSGSKYVTVHHTDNGWLYPFNNLDQYPIDGSADNNYIYRIVEGTVEDGKFKQAAENGTITIGGNTYVVTAEAKATPNNETNSETNSADSSTGNTATVNGGTITGGSGKIELTNTLQNPKFGLNIIKKDAENGENNKEVFLKDVEFKLEKLKAETTTEGEPQVDTTYTFTFGNTTSTGSITATTGDNGEITNKFTNLEPGTYRLTETKAHPGYNLLAQPIKIQFTQDGKCYIDGQRITDEGKFKPGANNTYTMNLTVLNRKTPELPHTGADAPSLWLLIGMPLAVAGLLIFTFRYNRKGGRRH